MARCDLLSCALTTEESPPAAAKTLRTGVSEFPADDWLVGSGGRPAATTRPSSLAANVAQHTAGDRAVLRGHRP
ncbi:hypothetical protein NDU88_008115 [Pleurodeles waltl]|uniref:Uncharacterized protein n=1 Tax=Pleurodeles waltl TaxID=8319 RepID=A0AAV7QQU0_PLEWA|nr:hypothetical protein NDU88_008115 [Pleurodeles waltl]